MSDHLHVVSISLGSSKRNAREEIELLGKTVIVERIGTDGDTKKAKRLFAELDGKVNAFGLGGADLYVIAGNRRYTFHRVQQLIKHVKKTPVLDGSGLKNTLEREAIAHLDAQLHWATQRVLMVAAVDRFGMAEALAEHHADIVYGDLIFGLNMDYPLRTIESLRTAAHVVLPVLTQLPQHWFYPTGKKQESSVVGIGTRYYNWATVIAGDTHYVKRYAPEQLEGKIILTQTITEADKAWVKQRGARLVTTTPQLGNRHFATNVLEAIFVALSGKKQALSREEYLQYIHELDLIPREVSFS